MTTSVYESTVSMMQGLADTDLLIIKEFIKRLTSKPQEKREQEIYNPYKPLSREEIIDQLALARGHAEEGRIMEAHEASSNIRKKYAL